VYFSLQEKEEDGEIKQTEIPSKQIETMEKKGPHTTTLRAHY